MSEGAVDRIGDIPRRTYQKVQQLTLSGIAEVATFDFFAIVIKENSKFEVRQEQHFNLVGFLFDHFFASLNEIDLELIFSFSLFSVVKLKSELLTLDFFSG